MVTFLHIHLRSDLCFRFVPAFQPRGPDTVSGTTPTGSAGHRVAAGRPVEARTRRVPPVAPIYCASLS
ncbi:hypothetical protein CBM2610_A80451 [Cupriavidus taiwanensis]|nr:hypothetical protein CBM2610_A80451 [Cupriavidus taiwanensis]